MKLIDYYKKGVILSGQRKDEEIIFMGDAPDELFFINQALSDLKEPLADSVFDERVLTDEKADALSYGIAYLLSVHRGDAKMCSFLAAIYNGKRAAALSCTVKRKDFLNKEK